MTDSKYKVITPDGIHFTTINPRLVARQGISDEQLEIIKALHVERYETERVMETAAVEDLKDLASYLVGIDQRLQHAWKFEYNPNMYRFWDVPRCLCPSVDNSDRYPTGFYIINKRCPLHGG